MAGAVDRVAGGTAEAVVIARQIEVVLPLVGAMALKIIGVEVGDNASGSCVNEVSNAVVGHGDRRGRVGVGRRDELSRVVVRVVGCDAARPGAACEFAVGGVVIARPLSVGVEFVGHAARWFVVEPAGRVAVGERLVAVGRHCDLVAIGIVRVIDGINCATLRDDPPFGVVGRGDGVAERVGDGDLATERVVGIGRLVAERVDGLGNAALRVIDKVRRIAAPVGLRDLAPKCVVGVGRGYTRGGTRRDGQAAANDRFGRERRGRGDGRLDRRMGCAIDDRTRCCLVAERIYGNHDLSGNPHLMELVAAQSRVKPRTGSSDACQLGRSVLARLPGRGLAPPVSAERNVPRVIRDDAVRVVPVDLSVEVHVGDGQAPFTERIIAYVGVGERLQIGELMNWRIGECWVGGVLTYSDELVRGVVLVGRNQKSAAETGTGFADGAAKRVFVGTTPARRGEAFDRF